MDLLSSVKMNRHGHQNNKKVAKVESIKQHELQKQWPRTLKRASRESAFFVFRKNAFLSVEV
jgi:hypothetical protein